MCGDVQQMLNLDVRMGDIKFLRTPGEFIKGKDGFESYNLGRQMQFYNKHFLECRVPSPQHHWLTTNSVLYLSDAQRPYTISFTLEGALNLGIPLILS
jgi:hypothetical protein